MDPRQHGWSLENVLQCLQYVPIMCTPLVYLENRQKLINQIMNSECQASAYEPTGSTKCNLCSTLRKSIRFERCFYPNNFIKMILHSLHCSCHSSNSSKWTLVFKTVDGPQLHSRHSQSYFVSFDRLISPELLLQSSPTDSNAQR